MNDFNPWWLFSETNHKKTHIEKKNQKDEMLLSRWDEHNLNKVRKYLLFYKMLVKNNASSSIGSTKSCNIDKNQLVRWKPIRKLSNNSWWHGKSVITC